MLDNPTGWKILVSQLISHSYSPLSKPSHYYMEERASLWIDVLWWGIGATGRKRIIHLPQPDEEAAIPFPHRERRHFLTNGTHVLVPVPLMTQQAPVGGMRFITIGIKYSSLSLHLRTPTAVGGSSFTDCDSACSL